MCLLDLFAYRFAELFLCPLFPHSSIDHEINVINAIHEKNMHNDVSRVNQLEKSTAKPGHDYCKFRTGKKFFFS